MNIQDYVLKNFELNHTIDLNLMDIGYGLEGANKVMIANSAGNYFENRENKNPPDYSMIEWKGKHIPILFSNSPHKEIITKNQNGHIQINYDLFGSIFYLLSGWQEIICGEKDQYGRFPYEKSIQKELGIVEVPVVDYYFDILSHALCEAYELDGIKRKLGNNGLVTFISHDIDQCKTGWKEAGFNQIKNMKFLSAAKIALNRTFGKDVWFNFNDILDYNHKRGIHASFFFLTRKGMNKKHNVMNADYSIQNKVFSSIFDDIRNNNCEVGLQGSLDTGLIKKDMELDKNTIPTEIFGNRCHFLLYNIYRLPAILDSCSIEYDNSTCYAEHIGFRHSTCSPFYLYDFENERIGQCIELPLSIMDRTLSQKKYMNVKQTDVLEACKKVILETAKFNGVLSILWHNHHFSNYKFEGWRETLDTLLNFIEENGVDYRSGHEVVQILKGN